ncbi:MAG: hypothetical protein WCF67_00210 [Chitinophagaceae bacterium]
MSDKRIEKRKDLPANADVNPKASDNRHQQQEEYDNLGKDERQKESEVRNTQRMERMGDSQQGDERMISPSKEKAIDQNRRDRHPE